MGSAIHTSKHMQNIFTSCSEAWGVNLFLHEEFPQIIFQPSMRPDRWDIIEERRAVLTEDFQRKRKPPELQENIQYWQLGPVEHTDPEYKQAMTE